MSEPGPDTESARYRAERRRRLEQVFGKGLPQRTRDDLEDSRRSAEEEQQAEEWLRRQVPPHHG